jgi:hypothetical protein
MTHEDKLDTAIEMLFQEAIPWAADAVENRYRTFAERAEEDRQWQMFRKGLSRAGNSMQRTLKVSRRAWKASFKRHGKGAML